ncbi:hypothetical protein ABEU96_16105, partial [Aneurinibacillus aneurinilyticus]
VQLPIQEKPLPNTELPAQELPNTTMPPTQPIMPYVMPPAPMPGINPHETVEKGVEYKKKKEKKCESTSSYWHGESPMMPYPTPYLHSYPAMPHDMQGGYPFTTANIMNPYTYSPGMLPGPYHMAPPYGLPYAPYCHPHMPAIQPIYKHGFGCHESSLASDSSHC